MKKWTCNLFFCAAVCLLLCAGCASSHSGSNDGAAEGKIGESAEKNAGSVETIDLFADVQLEYSGWNGTGGIAEIRTEKCSSVVKKLVTFSVEEETNTLKNDDIVVITADYDEEQLRKAGYQAKGDSKKYVVEELPSIQEAWDYQDDVTWVLKDDNIWSCCNQKGDIQFSLEKEESPSTCFKNGVALINDYTELINAKGDVIWSVDTDGESKGKELFTEESFDGVEIVNDSYNTGGDRFLGYTFVQFHTESFQLTAVATGILDEKGEWILEPEVNLEFSSWDNNEDGNGIFYTNDNRAWHATENKFVRTDGETSEVDQWKMDFYYDNHDGMKFEAYDYSLSDGGAFYDRNNQKMIDLSQFHLRNEPEFIDGYAILEIENEQGSDYYTIIDKEGNEMFDPKKSVNHDELSAERYWISDQGYGTVSGDIIGTEYSEGGLFYNGLAQVKTRDTGAIHFVNTDGKIIY